MLVLPEIAANTDVSLVALYFFSRTYMLGCASWIIVAERACIHLHRTNFNPCSLSWDMSPFLYSLLAIIETEHCIPWPLPPNAKVARTLSKSHLLVSNRDATTNQASATARSSALALAPLPWACNTTHTAIAGCPRCYARGSSSVWARWVRACCTMIPIPRSSQSRVWCAAVRLAGATVTSAST
jgi:hypothetical protein